jgi:poly-gamma-glutamate biosynthesis protein PgsC/CapC
VKSWLIYFPWQHLHTEPPAGLQEETFGEKHNPDRKQTGQLEGLEEQVLITGFDLAIAIGLGVAFSLIFHEVFGLAAGGIVVPGYIALNFHEPYKLAGTLIVSIVVWGCIKLIGQFIFIYGRRRMVLAVLLGFIIGYISKYYIFPPYADDVPLEVIGYIIPGLIANWMERQGAYKTITTVFLGGAMVRLLWIIVTGGKVIGNV